MVETTTTTVDNSSKPVVAVVAPPTQQVTIVPKGTQDASDRRKTWALWILLGGGLVMSLYATYALYLVQSVAHYAFYLGLAAMGNIFMIFSGLAGLLVKRSLNIGKSGIVLEDHDLGDKQS